MHRESFDAHIWSCLNLSTCISAQIQINQMMHTPTLRDTHNEIFWEACWVRCQVAVQKHDPNSSVKCRSKEMILNSCSHLNKQLLEQGQNKSSGLCLPLVSDLHLATIHWKHGSSLSYTWTQTYVLFQKSHPANHQTTCWTPTQTLNAFIKNEFHIHSKTPQGSRTDLSS